jgi:hypothetical protein
VGMYIYVTVCVCQTVHLSFVIVGGGGSLLLLLLARHAAADDTRDFRQRRLTAEVPLHELEDHGPPPPPIHTHTPLRVCRARGATRVNASCAGSAGQRGRAGWDADRTKRSEAHAQAAAQAQAHAQAHAAGPHIRHGRDEGDVTS